MKTLSTLSRLTCAAAAAAFLLGAAVETAEAMPAAPLAAPAASLDHVAYGLHRHYPGYNSRMARRFRHARRMSPNKYCRNQPSRCR